MPSALREIWWSANSDSAITYRQRVGLFTRPSVGVVMQSLLDPDVAGVMFTENPVTGADERVIEASWGLGEAVVAGSRDPRHVPRRPRRRGARAHARAQADRDPFAPDRRHGRGGRSPPSSPRRSALDDDQLAQLNQLAVRCEEVYGKARDIEWAFADGTLYLLQCRAVTTGASHAAAPAPDAGCRRPGRRPAQRVPLFAGLDDDEVEQIARLFKVRQVRRRARR